MGLQFIPPAIAYTTALVRQASLYLGKRAAEKLAREGAKDALEAAAKKATNKGIKDMRAANRLGTNIAKKAPKKKKNFGEKVVETLAPLSKGNKKIAPAIKGNVVNRKTALGYFVGGIGATKGAEKAAEYIMKDDKPKSKTTSKTTKGTSEKPKSRNTVKEKTKSKIGNKGAIQTKTSTKNKADPKDFPTYKKGTKSAGSFRAATAAAKKAGKKTFTWEGRKYSTKEK